MKLTQSAGTVEYTDFFSAVGWDSHKEYPVYDTKKSDGDTSVKLELWEMQSTPLFPSLLGPLWPRMVVPDRVLSMSQIKLNCVLMLNRIAWNRTVLTIKLRTYAKLNCLK